MNSSSHLHICYQEDYHVLNTANYILNLWYVIVTVPIYTYVIVVLVWFKSQLKSAFFTLAISAGAADLAWIATIALLRHHNDAAEMSDPWLTMVTLLATYLQWTQVAGMMILTLNRFTAMANPVSYDHKWTMKTIRVTIGGQWTAAPQLLIIGIIVLKIGGQNAWNIYWAGIPILITLLLVTLHIRMVRSYRKQKQSNMSRSPHARNADVRLAMIGAALSCFYICMSVRYFTLPMELMVSAGQLSFDVFCIVDKVLIYFEKLGEALFVSCNPFIYLIFSSEIRKYCKRMLFGPRHRRRGSAATPNRARDPHLSTPSGIEMHRLSTDSSGSMVYHRESLLSDISNENLPRISEADESDKLQVSEDNIGTENSIQTENSHETNS